MSAPAPIATVSGTSSQEVPPDLATLWVSVELERPDKDAARRELASGVDALVALLREYSDALESQSTSGISLAPVYDHRRRKTTGYRASSRRTLVVRDLDALGALVPALMELPDCRVDGPSWSLRPENPVFRQARLAAIADAKRVAVDYAAAFGARVAGLLEVSDLSEMSPAPYGKGYAMASMARGGMEADAVSLDVEPPLQQVDGRVTVRFALSEPTQLD